MERQVGRKYSDKGMETKRSGKCEKEHVCLVGIPKREKRKEWAQIIFEEIMAKTFSKIQLCL